ncbi:MAG TPA: hypothetical protein VFM46_00880 [Pseudomonadales bacterium]|nr:hypothetical protein [Pseudomonadales bacterium]
MSAAERLDWLFKNSSATKASAALACETSVAHIRRWCRSSWEDGGSQPRAWQLSQLCKYLQLSPTWLLNGRGPQNLDVLLAIHDPNNPITGSYRLAYRMRHLPDSLKLFIGIFVSLLAPADKPLQHVSPQLKAALLAHAQRYAEFAKAAGAEPPTRISDDFDPEAPNAKELLKTPSGRLKWVRKDRGLTHAHIAQNVVGVTTRAYTYWENSDWTNHGTRQPYAQTLHLICQHTGMAESWVLWGEGPATLAYVYPWEDPYLPSSLGGPNAELKDQVRIYYEIAINQPKLRDFIHNLVEFTYSLWVTNAQTTERLTNLIEQFADTYQAAELI